MDAHFDAASQAMFDRACASLKAGADHVAILEQALDVICMLLRREEDAPLRHRAMAALSDCLAEMDRRGDLPAASRADFLRDAAHQTIRLVIFERAGSAGSGPLPALGCPTPGRRTTDRRPDAP